MEGFGLRFVRAAPAGGLSVQQLFGPGGEAQIERELFVGGVLGVHDAEDGLACALAQPGVHALVPALAGHPLEAAGVILARIKGRLGGVKAAQSTEIFLERIVEGVLEQVPVQLPLFVPLPEMPQLVAHEIELFARVRIHIEIEGAQLGAFFFVGAPELVDDCLFAVDDLVVAQRQQVKLVVEIVHTENDLSVCVGTLAEGGSEVVQRIVHPAHVPLVVEADAVVAGGGCDFEEVGGIFGHVNAGGPALVQAVVEVPQEGDGALVDAPGGVALPVEGAGDGVHPDAVAVIDLHPEGGGAVQEAAHLPAVVVEVAGTPLAVAHIAVVFVEVGAVKVGQCVGVGRKVDGDKVHDDADAHPVAGVDEGGELGRGAVPAGDGEVAGGLVAPAAVEGVFCQRQKLYMGEVVFQQPGNELPGQLFVIIPAVRAVGLGGVGLMLPAAGMEFVDIHGQITAFIPPLHPCAVIEGKVQFGQAAGVGGADFGRESVGVGPHDHAAVGPVDAVFVELPLAQPGYKAAPHTGVGFLERDACAPAVKAAADLHGRGTGSPDREAPALFAVVTLPGVCAEDAVGIEAVAVEEGFGDGGKIHTKDSFYRNFYRTRTME